MPALQLEGKDFGYWTVNRKDIELSKQKKQSYWKCKCNLCNSIYSVRGSALTTGEKH